MKTSFIILFLILCQACFGQTINELSPEDFENISINSRSIKAIWETNGEEINVMNLLGQPTTSQVNDPTQGVIAYTYFYTGFRISFSSHIASNGNLISIVINSSTPTLRIKGVSIKVGDNINKLSGYQKNKRTNGDESISLSPSNDETIYLIINFDLRTGEITNMKYLQLT